MTEDWVTHCDQKLQEQLRYRVRTSVWGGSPTRRAAGAGPEPAGAVPASPTNSQDTSVVADKKGNYTVPIPATTTATSNRRSLFEFGIHNGMSWKVLVCSSLSVSFHFSDRMECSTNDN